MNRTNPDLSAYNKCETFNDLCLLGAKYVNDEIKDFPCWYILDDKNLYEMEGEYEWIRDVIYQMNLNGFFTHCSQPGVCDPESTYKQRAFICGLMEKDRAVELFNILKGDPRIVIEVKSFEQTLSNKYNLPKDESNYEIASVYNKEGRTYFGAPPPYIFKADVPFIAANYQKNLAGLGVMDTNWNDNTHLWNTVLSAIKKLSK